MAMYGCVPTPREIDEPFAEWNERYGAPMLIKAPANFSAMSDDQTRDWPTRAAIRWIVPRVLVCSGVAALGVLALVRLHWQPALGAVGLVYDILGVWWLADGLLPSDEEAYREGSIGAVGKRDLATMLARRQAFFSLGVASIGFCGQFGAVLPNLLTG